MKRAQEDLPPRLTTGDGAAAELLRKYERQATHAPAEAVVWERTLARLVREVRPRRLRLALFATAGALAGALVVNAWLTVKPPTGKGARSVAEARSAASGPVVAVGEDRSLVPPMPQSKPQSLSGPEAASLVAPRIELGRSRVALPTGPVQLIGEARVTLSSGASARAWAGERNVTVELSAGEIELVVEKRKQPEGRAFDVVSAPYRFSVLGTRFRVARVADGVTLSVSEGRVAVRLATQLVAVVSEGGRWTSPAQAAARTLEPGLTAGAAQAGPAASAWLPPTAFQRPLSWTRSQAASASVCAAQAGRDVRARIDCYVVEARGSGLGAEVALYEIARLRQDALSDTAGALGALREHRSRFPTGALRTEVDLSIAELLPRLGRYREALDQATALLGAYPRGERRGELQLLRGHVLREGLHDCANAERAYSAALEAAAGGRAADPAAFWRAVCLETLGRREEAREAYERYLRRASPALAAEAKRRMGAIDGEMSPEHSGESRAPNSQSRLGGPP